MSLSGEVNLHKKLKDEFRKDHFALQTRGNHSANIIQQIRNGTDCHLTNIRRAKVRIYGPSHEKTRDFLQKEEKEIQAWTNNYKFDRILIGNEYT